MRLTALLLVKHQGLWLMICVKITQPFHVLLWWWAGYQQKQWYAVQKTGWQHKQSGVLLFMLIVLETTCWKWWIWILQIKVKIKGLNIYLFCRTTIIVHLTTNFLAINFDGYGHGVMEMSQIWKHKRCSGWFWRMLRRVQWRVKMICCCCKGFDSPLPESFIPGR